MLLWQPIKFRDMDKVHMNLRKRLKKHFQGMVWWCDGSGLTSSAGTPTIRITVGQGPTALAVGEGGDCLDIFTLIYPLFSFSLSLGDSPI